MNVLYVLFSKGFGGLERYAIAHAQDMVAKGHRIYFLRRHASKVADAVRNMTEFSGEEVNPVKYIDLLTMLDIRSYIKKNKVDIVHVNQSADLGLVAPALWRLGSVRLIFSNYMQVPTPKKDLYHRLEYGRIEKILVASEYMRQNALANLPVTPEQVEILPYGLTLDRFNPDAPKKNEIRKTFNLADDTQLIGVISRLDPLKGQMEMIRAMPSIISKNPKARLALTGDETPELEGQYKHKLITEVKKLGLENYVFFTGQTNDTPGILSELDVYVLPSHSETFALGCLEAMAMKKPVVGTNSGGTKEMLDYGECGLLAEPKSPTALATSVNRLLADKVLRADLASKARAKIENFYDRKVVVKRLNAIYENEV
ncbi:hypothetical protein MNBD_NITROSPINAE01-1370 [hydrothermal vent metagenome]|uniref:Glycosyltransferase n=1 Tax=hydrothermal vent metagenome TaxID=652676 RepID=A0A3B1BZH2_9ZZZZ